MPVSRAAAGKVLRPPRADKYTRADLLGGPDGEFAVAGVDGASVACFRMDLEVRGLRWLHSCAKRPARPLHPCSVKGPAAACLCHGFGERFTVLHADSAASRLAAPDSSCQLVNARGQRLVASHYLPCERWKTEKTLPCVVYCHGNAGCRADANIVAFALLRRGLTCFCFDFAGSGLSDGELVTLGAHETGDLDAVVRFLRLQGRTSNIAVWGRSMGAVTAALFARTNLSIAGVVMDSPFARLTDLIRDIVTRDIVAEAPGVLVSAAILALRTSIRRRAGVDIAAIDALVAAPECYQPALFVHAREDELIYPSHSQSIAAAWAGDSRVLLVGERQSHNTLRPRHIIASCVHFLGNVLGGGLKDAEAIYMNVGDGAPSVSSCCFSTRLTPSPQALLPLRRRTWATRRACARRCCSACGCAWLRRRRGRRRRPGTAVAKMNTRTMPAWTRLVRRAIGRRLSKRSVVLGARSTASQKQRRDEESTACFFHAQIWGQSPGPAPSSLTSPAPGCAPVSPAASRCRHAAHSRRPPCCLRQTCPCQHAVEQRFQRTGLPCRQPRFGCAPGPR